ncbi:unnamed protein product [Calicophoron daubneyi]|uniref:Protein kinase domain-containing protein n=1 Tax=Calicophoron daubneyi TaxID=300641 RepID=A0AAV2SYK0_CALDB
MHYSGHFAEVNLCVNRATKREYAAKFINKQKVASSTFTNQPTRTSNLADIDREAFILSNLRHDNIVKLHEVFHCEESVVLILDLVTGGELFARVAECERLSEEEASNFVEQILLGVQHMHSLGVVHLDLKPENIMIEDLECRKIKIIDFGLARLLNPNEIFQDMAGTPEFCAPEIVNFDPITFATDMWAIGVITYILLTGISPFAGDSQIETFQNILDCVVDYTREEIQEATELAKDFIRRLLVKNPRKRATVSECLQHPWIKPCDKIQKKSRQGSLIRKANLDGLRQFVATPTTPDKLSPPSPSKLKELQQSEQTAQFFGLPETVIHSLSSQLPTRSVQVADANQKESFETPAVENGCSGNVDSTKEIRNPDLKRTSVDKTHAPPSPSANIGIVLQSSPVLTSEMHRLSLATSVSATTNQPHSTPSSVHPPTKSAIGWRASLGNSLIGRLGAAFVAATTHQTNTIGLASSSSPINDSVPSGEAENQNGKANGVRSSTLAPALTKNSRLEHHGRTSVGSKQLQTLIQPDRPKKPPRRGLQFGIVSSAVRHIDSAVQERDGSSGHSAANGALPRNSVPSLRPNSQNPDSFGLESTRQNPMKPSQFQNCKQTSTEPNRAQVGRLQQMFEAGAAMRKANGALQPPYFGLRKP